MATPLSALDKIRAQIEAYRAQVKDDLMQHLSQLDPYEFEHLMRDLLEKMSFTNCIVTQQYKDGGIDLKADFSIGISEIRTLGQVKRIKRTVGVVDLQQFYGAMIAQRAKDEVHLGLYITTSSFASGAVKWVADSHLPIVLVDGARLVDLLVEHGLLVQQVPLPPALALAVPSGDEDATVTDATKETDGGSDAYSGKRLFKWDLRMRRGGSFTLYCNYLADPSLSFEVSGTLVPSDQDYKPARTELHRQICDGLRGIFPDLDREHLSAKAWGGTHKIYPSKEYGG
ncbi:MAG: restriction endonuclease [Armatimonadetes bacterium]|nr:restriction endonuclease [Armatimonadota bacterium]